MNNDDSHVRAESDLSSAVTDGLKNLGYTVRAEVKNCDVVAIRGEELIVVELKKSLSLELLLQAAQRQRITDSVYVAVPRPESSLRSTRWRRLFHMLRRLELGLIFVSYGRPNRGRMELVFHPLPFSRRKNGKQRRAVIREIRGRSGDFNTGGSAGKKIMTAYRETCIHIACCLEAKGSQSPRQLRELGTGPKTQDILYQNHYGWFDRIDRGLYDISASGRRALVEYGEIADLYRNNQYSSSSGS